MSRDRLALPLDPRSVRRALFVRLRRFGDTIMMAPALAAFRRWAPHARVGVVLQPGYSAFVDLLPFVDDVLTARVGPIGAARALREVRAWAPGSARRVRSGRSGPGLPTSRSTFTAAPARPP